MAILHFLKAMPELCTFLNAQVCAVLYTITVRGVL